MLVDNKDKTNFLFYLIQNLLYKIEEKRQNMLFFGFYQISMFSVCFIASSKNHKINSTEKINK